MRKILALFIVSLLAVTLFSACNKETDNVTLGTSEANTPRIDMQILKKEVDFEQGNIITAKDTELSPALIQALQDPDQPIATLQRETTPEKVWEASPLTGSADYTLPEAVKLPNGSVGVLSVPKIDLKANIYETDSAIEDMRTGVAHMKETSCWDGNIGLAAHNRGVSTYFGKVHKLETGDEVQITTALGTRTYKVTQKVVIDEMDWSMFGRSDSNVVTMLTCIDNQPTKRLVVRAEEVK